MPRAGRRIDPGSIAGWLVRSVEQYPQRPDDLLARLTATTRAQITAARAAALQPSTALRHGHGAVDPVTGTSALRRGGQPA